MTAITVVDWPARARRLAEKLAEDGDLHSPQWKSAVCAVPRHEFIPHYYRHDTGTRPATWQLVVPSDPSEVQAWLDLVYSDTTLITAVADYAERGVQIPVSSSSKPDLMVRMLEELDVTDGDRVLEIGTGTGYNAALLSHRLGSRNVFSVDVDPDLMATARLRLPGWAITPRSQRWTVRRAWPRTRPMTGSSRPARYRPYLPPGSSNWHPVGESWQTSKVHWVRATWSRCTNRQLCRYWKADSCPGGADSCGCDLKPGRPWEHPGLAGRLESPGLRRPQSTQRNSTPSSASWPRFSFPAAPCSP